MKHWIYAALATIPPLLATGTAAAAATEPVRPDQESFLMRAVFADGRVWLLSDAGQLRSVREGATTRPKEALPRRALDLCAHKAAPLVLTEPDKQNWALLHRAGSAWKVTFQVAREGDDFVALHCDADDVIVLTSRRIIQIARERQSSSPLTGDMRSRGILSAMLVTRDSVFLGFNAGEWGGGLRRIDRKTGAIEMIKSNDGCGGLLSPDCDPVHGIATIPWNPDCIAVAVGLVHLLEHGRIVKICGDTIEMLFTRRPSCETITCLIARLVRDSVHEYVHEAMFGLISDGKTMLALGSEGLYRIEERDKVRRMSMPRFQSVEGIPISFDIPGFVLVRTLIDARHSMGGGLPRLVVRDK